MDSDVSLMGVLSPGKVTARLPRISWIEVITAFVQCYCIMCHCIFLMLIAVWMFIKEVSKRSAVRWNAWYGDLKQKRQTAIPFVLEALHVPVMMSRPTPTDVPAGCFKFEYKNPPETCVEEAKQTWASSVGVTDFEPNITEAEGSPPASRQSDMTETKNRSPLRTRPDSRLQMPTIVKRLPCSISAVVGEKYACGTNTSTSSSTMSLDEMDDSSEEDALATSDRTNSKSSDWRVRSANNSTPGSWKIRAAVHKGDKVKTTPGSLASSKTPPRTPEKKFSLTPVLCNIKRACSRTLSLINKELSECITAQLPKDRRKSKSPGPTSLVASRRAVREQSSQVRRDIFQDLSLPEARTSLQSSWNDDRSSGDGTRASSSTSDSCGEMHRGLLDSFSETESSNFPQQQARDNVYAEEDREENRAPFMVNCGTVDGRLSKGDATWTPKSQPDAFLNDDGGCRSKNFGGVFGRDNSESSWEF
ncbi:unnamed protein product [Ixodes pacificus]